MKNASFYLIGAIITSVVAWYMRTLRPPSSIPEIQWHDLQRRMASNSPPTHPLRVINSPQQQWLISKGHLWTPARMMELAQTIDTVGSTVVNLKSISSSPSSSSSFTHYYDDVNNQKSTSLHTTTPTLLRDALSLIWPTLTSSNANTNANTNTNTNTPSSSSPHQYYYLSPDIQSLPPELLPYDPESLLTWIPAGCLNDDTRHPFRNSTAQQCRGLASNLWIGQDGGVSAAMHYDLQHNIFVQASGMKRFSLLPPKLHSFLQLYPRWHGSRRQAQIHYPTIATQTKIKDAVVIAELQAGDALYVPPLWLHYVESIKGGVAANFWTNSLASDIWLQLCQRNEDEGEDMGIGMFEVPTFGNWIDVFDLATTASPIAHAQVVIHTLLAQLKEATGAMRHAAVAAHADVRGGKLETKCPTFNQIVNACQKKRIEHKAQLIPSVVKRLHAYTSVLKLLDVGSRSLLLTEFVDEFAIFAVQLDGHSASCAAFFVDHCISKAEDML